MRRIATINAALESVPFMPCLKQHLNNGYIRARLFGVSTVAWGWPAQKQPVAGADRVTHTQEGAISARPVPAKPTGCVSFTTGCRDNLHAVEQDTRQEV